MDLTMPILRSVIDHQVSVILTVSTESQSFPSSLPIGWKSLLRLPTVRLLRAWYGVKRVPPTV